MAARSLVAGLAVLAALVLSVVPASGLGPLYGTVAGPDGSTPIGPPLAIAITLGIALPGLEGSTQADQGLKLYRIAIGQLFRHCCELTI